MTDTTKAQILEVARKAIHTEMLSLKRMEDTLGDEFATAVEMILGSRGKCIVTGRSLRPEPRASFSTPAKPSTATWA